MYDLKRIKKTEDIEKLKHYILSIKKSKNDEEFKKYYELKEQLIYSIMFFLDNKGLEGYKKRLPSNNGILENYADRFLNNPNDTIEYFFSENIFIPFQLQDIFNIKD